jgi:hypothetical protein
VILGDGIYMDWGKLFINWEAPLFWSVFGVIGGVLVARYYYKKTGADLKELRDAILERIEMSVGISEEVKQALKISMEGVFYTYPWEKEFSRKLLGDGPGRQKLGG